MTSGEQYIQGELQSQLDLVPLADLTLPTVLPAVDTEGFLQTTSGQQSPAEIPATFPAATASPATEVTELQTTSPPTTEPASLADELQTTSPEFQTTTSSPNLEPQVATVSPPRKRIKRLGGRSQEAKCRDYVVRFKGNDSRQWDGKEITVDTEWLEDLYSKSELCPGRVVELPWEKNGQSIGWKGVIVSVPAGRIEGT